jgi:hypothetical protein
LIKKNYLYFFDIFFINIIKILIYKFNYLLYYIFIFLFFSNITNLDNNHLSPLLLNKRDNNIEQIFSFGLFFNFLFNIINPFIKNFNNLKFYFFGTSSFSNFSSSIFTEFNFFINLNKEFFLLFIISYLYNFISYEKNELNILLFFNELLNLYEGLNSFLYSFLIFINFNMYSTIFFFYNFISNTTNFILNKIKLKNFFYFFFNKKLIFEFDNYFINTENITSNNNKSLFIYYYLIFILFLDIDGNNTDSQFLNKEFSNEFGNDGVNNNVEQIDFNVLFINFLLKLISNIKYNYMYIFILFLFLIKNYFFFL